MAFSQYLGEEILNWISGNSFASAPQNYLYITLHTADPGSDGLTGDTTNAICNITHKEIAVGSFNSPAASGAGWEIVNSTVIPMVGAAVNSTPITVTHFGVWDDANPKNFLASGALSASVEIQSGDTVQFNGGAMAVKVV